MSGWERVELFPALGLRYYWRRPGEAGVTLILPGKRVRPGADDADSVCLLEGQDWGMRRRSDRSAYELTQRALVFLVNARALRRPV